MIVIITFYVPMMCKGTFYKYRLNKIPRDHDNSCRRHQDRDNVFVVPENTQTPHMEGSFVLNPPILPEIPI